MIKNWQKKAAKKPKKSAKSDKKGLDFCLKNSQKIMQKPLFFAQNIGLEGPKTCKKIWKNLGS